MSDFQVIIIGGRPAGASLAIRLGWQNIKTLLVDRMTFPSLPGVPSGPILYSQHLEALEELGLTEEELFYPDGRIDVLDVSFVGYLQAAIPLKAAPATHAYGYGADRTKFDTAIWDKARKQKSVTARSGFAVTGIVRESGRVTGIRGQAEGGKEETITADLVVGADGRFSFAAGQFEAATLEEHNKHTTSTYFADWEDVADGSVPRAQSTYNTAKGFLVLMIPINTRKYIVATYFRPQHLRSDVPVEQSYLEGLQSIPEAWARLKDARRVTPVIGMKGIRNGYRQPAGDGWALVGDAFHYKDPLDGQGIYDALFQSRFLSEAISEWQTGGKSWEQAGGEYAERAIKAIRPMMLQTVKRVKDSMFADPPPFIIKSVVRWLLNDPEYQRDFLGRLTRATDPATWKDPGAMVGRAIWQGIMNDLFKPKPATPLPGTD